MAKYVAVNIAVAVGYFLAASLGLSLATVSEQVSPVWPPTGFSIAVVLIAGWWVVPGIAIGAFTANALANEPLLTAAGIALGNTLEAWVAAWILVRVVNFQCAMQRKQDVVGFAAAGGCIGPFLSASIGVTSLCLGGVEGWDRFGVLWLTWWFGNAVGAIIVAPPIITLTHWVRCGCPIRRAAEIVLFVGCVAIISVLVLMDPAVEMHLKYLLFPLFVWGALRFEQLITALTLAVVCIIAVFGVQWHRGLSRCFVEFPPAPDADLRRRAGSFLFDARGGRR